MPSWSVHVKWAIRMGISEESEEIVREINLLIDSPEEWFKNKYPMLFENIPPEELQPMREDPCVALFEASNIVKKFGHDIGRSSKRKWQIKILAHCVYKHYGVEGVKASVLHHALDLIEYYATKSPGFTVNDILKRIEDRFSELIMPSREELESYPSRTYKPTDADYAISEATKEVIEFIKQNIISIIEDIKA